MRFLLQGNSVLIDGALSLLLGGKLSTGARPYWHGPHLTEFYEGVCVLDLLQKASSLANQQIATHQIAIISARLIRGGSVRLRDSKG